MAKHYSVPVVTFSWLADVPFVTDQGQSWGIDASSIWQAKNPAKDLMTLLSTTSSYGTYNNITYVEEIGGMICTPYYRFEDTLKANFGGTGKWIEVQDTKKMLQYPLSEAKNGELSPYVTKSFSDSINRSFCIMFRHRKSPESVKKPADFWLEFGVGTSCPIRVKYIEGNNSFIVEKYMMKQGTSGTMTWDVFTENILIVEPAKAGSRSWGHYNGNRIALTVLFLGNNLLIGNGLPDESSVFSGKSVLTATELNPGGSKDSTIDPTTGKSSADLPKYDGTFGMGTAVSLSYALGTISFRCAYAQFEVAWVPVEFSASGTFTFENAGIPELLNDKGIDNMETPECEIDPDTAEHYLDFSSVNKADANEGGKTGVTPEEKEANIVYTGYDCTSRYVHIPKGARVIDTIIAASSFYLPSTGGGIEDTPTFVPYLSSYSCTLKSTPEIPATDDSAGVAAGAYTPVWYRIKGHTKPTIVGLKVPQMASAFVLSINGTETPDGKEYTVVLRNNKSDGTAGGQWKYLRGCYPVTLSFGWSFADGVTPSTETLHFTGFVTEISYSRDAHLSTVTLTLTDKKQVIQDYWALNLPIYDGWFDTDVIQDLAIRAGIVKPYTDGITSYTTYVNPNTGISYADLIINVIKPRRLSRGNFKDVLWMFMEGTTMWDCMKKVADYTGCWLYFNPAGNLCYTHVAKVMADKKRMALTDEYTFREVTKVSNYNELRRLSYVKSFRNTYNRVGVRGVSPLYTKVADGILVKKPGTPESYRASMDPSNSTADGWIPWNKTIIRTDPCFNTQQAVTVMCEELYLRMRRPGYTVSWETWGQPKLFPLDFVRIQEAVDDGGNHTVGSEENDYFIITGIIHALDAQNKSYTSTINADYLFNDWNYDQLF